MIDLPEGWAWGAAPDEPRFAFVFAPGGATCVTVDYERRSLRASYGGTGRLIRTDAVYRGRGWRERLEADAVAWLRQAGERLK